ncbi:MAG: ABC transporter permease [Opitutales bacterium]|nr:ABC transporter permease [Opitutales bacterium]
MSEAEFKTRHPGLAWLAKMAWRDSRGQRRLLALFTLSIVFGVGAVVAIQSLRSNLSDIIEVQSRALLGADLVLRSQQAFGVEMDAFMADLGGQQTREIRLRSMAFFPGSSGSQFVQLRALDGPYPLYGEMETEPVELGPNPNDWQDGVLVEENLMIQQQLAPGDSIRLGDAEFRIAGRLVRVSGESEVSGFFSPRIYLTIDQLQETGLLQEGSIINHRAYFRFPDGLTETIQEKLQEARNNLFVDYGIRRETAENRQERVERILANLFDFLNLIGFIALLLGGIGVAGAVHIFLQQKVNTMALLRCLGASSGLAFQIYWLQVSVVGMLGALVGAMLGVGIQFLLPIPLRAFLPFPIEVQFDPGAVLAGLLFGWLIVSLFSFVPLLKIRGVSPLKVIRSSVGNARPMRRDPLFWALIMAIVAAISTFSVLQTQQWTYGLAFVAGLGGSLLLLAGLAWLLRWALRLSARRSGSFAWRLGLSNLYRPNNRTLLMVVSIGMGVLLIHTLFLVRAALLHQVEGQDTGDAPNVILLDVQSDQLDDLQSFLSDNGFSALETLPIVTMRVAAINGREMRELREDPDAGISHWIFSWEFRNTFRDHVLDNATVIEGEFVPRYDGPEPYPISLSENVLDDMKVGIGDRISWNVQGVRIETVVSSVRLIEWEVGRQNFNVVFPLGTIEDAPVVYAVTVRARDRAESSSLQASLTQRFPNVSMLDLTLLFETINNILDRAAFVIHFMAAFTIATGLTVLAGSVVTSRYQRIKESVLLRTLGASGAFIRKLLMIEFLLLGFIAAAAGILLSIVSTWALLWSMFDLELVLNWQGSLLTLVSVVALTLITGLLTTRGIASQPPLAVLRREEG